MDLSDIRPDTAERNQQRALLRLQLRFTGETHRLYLEYLEWLMGKVATATDSEGTVSDTRMIQALNLSLVFSFCPG